ncbi:hypothetical protein PISMIDRAFT_287194 [Pisolithus microcarpus 441]|uniref:Uncharacterized protein n=1 Tax=Pisolithus microcarpus 441 TaxID=765257 RepID=A0A0C9YMI6_9AGAM|nr:hypothetical protein PISMIDRAFT_287194 [Pisolithus microcarpus 441]
MECMVFPAVDQAFRNAGPCQAEFLCPRQYRGERYLAATNLNGWLGLWVPYRYYVTVHCCGCRPWHVSRPYLCTYFSHRQQRVWLERSKPPVRFTAC